MRVRVDFWLPEDMAVEIIAKVLAEQGRASKAAIFKEAREVMESYGYQWTQGDDIGSPAEEEHYEIAQDIYDRFAARWDL